MRRGDAQSVPIREAAGLIPRRERQTGYQIAQTWNPGEVDPRPLGDYGANLKGLTRLSVTGRVFLDLTWGTGGTRTLRVRAPLLFAASGKVCIEAATPIDDAGTTAVISLVEVTSSGLQLIRAAAATGDAVHPFAARFVAYEPSVITVNGLAVAVPTLGVCPVIPDSVVTAGSGLLEFEL